MERKKQNCYYLQMVSIQRKVKATDKNILFAKTEKKMSNT